MQKLTSPSCDRPDSSALSKDPVARSRPMKDIAPSSGPFVSTSSTLENAREFRKHPRISLSPQRPHMPHLSVAASRIEGYRGDRDSWQEGCGRGGAGTVGEGALLGIARSAGLGNQGRGACSSTPSTMNDDAGFPAERDRTTGFSTGSEDQRDVDSCTGRERTTRSCAEPEDQGDVDSFIGCDGATGSFERIEASELSHEGDVRFRINRATGTRPGRSPHRSPGGVFSPRSGRRSPVRVLSGGPAAGCRNQHSAKPPPLDLPAGS